MTKRFVVGVDGSVGSSHALRWAIEEARHHDATVTACMAWTLLDQHHAEPGTQFDPTYGEKDALRALEHYVDEVAGEDGVGTEVVCDLAADGLVDAAIGAALLVVGARGLGGFSSLLLGSVSERVLERSTVPVAVIREPSTNPLSRSVTVGIDGSTSSHAALKWAAAEARARRARLHLVHAWQAPFTPGFAETSTELVRSGAVAVLDAASKDPVVADLSIETHLLYGSAASAVLEVAARGSLVVIGTRGRGRLAGAILGSTSRQVAHHASCPVVVVPLEA